MGHPIAHSRSPLLHGYWLGKLGIEGSYERLDLQPPELESFFGSYREEGWIGGNVTVPDKTAVIPFLDRIDADASAIGAVNTIWWEGEDLVGGNTDAIGFLGNIDELAPGWDRQARRALILGAGGATRAAVHGLLGRGLEVAVCNRTFERAQTIAGHFGGRVTAHREADLEALLHGCDLFVNTTSLGMSKQPPLDIDLSPLPREAIVYDIVYVPLETELLKQAKAGGRKTVDGLGMLLHQAVEGFRRWFGQRPEVTAELRQILVDDINARAPVA